MVSVRLGWHRLLRCAAVLMLLIPLLATAATYVYDANGRLRAVTSSTGASSEYIYDALGNIYAINPVPAGQLAIFAFTPNHGSVGTTVTISGQGFSTTPANNSVKFHGTAATVSTATATQLKVLVPAGATTGTISVQVSTSTATSVDIFTVTTDAGVAPVISSFTPAVIASAGAVTVNGSHFLTSAGATTAAIGEMNGTVSSLSDTQFTLTASADAASGYITATTPYGSAQSAQPLVVLPAGIAASQIIGVDYLVLNGAAQSLNVTAPNSYGAFVFQGTAGQYLSLQFSTVTPSSGVAYVVYDPAQGVVASSTLSSTNMSIHLPTLAKTGTYLILFASGSGTAQVTGALVSDPVVVRDGSTIAISTATTGQSIRLLFDLINGQPQSLGLSSISTNPSTGDEIYLQVFEPEAVFANGTPALPQWGNGCFAQYWGCRIDMFSPPTTGMYETIISTPGTITMSMSATLSSPITGTLTYGVTKSLSSTRPGQVALLTLNGTAGDLTAGAFANTVTSPSGSVVATQVMDANVNVIPTGSWYFVSSSVNSLNYSPLPATATYQVLIETRNAETFSGQYTIAKNPQKTLTIDAAAQSIAGTIPGEAAYLNFTGTAGQNLSFAVSSLVLTPDAGWVVGATITRPDGYVYQNFGVYSSNDGGGHVDMLNLPQSGKYSITLTPNSGEILSFKAAVMNAVTGTLTLGTAKTVSLTKPGQIGLYTFSASAGDLLSGYLGSVATTPGGYLVAVSALKTDGTAISSTFNWTFATTDGYTLNYAAIPATGTYEVLVEPNFVETVSAQLTVVRNPAQTLTIDAAPVAVSSAVPGTVAHLSFNGTAGQNLSLAISNIVQTPSSGSGAVVSVAITLPNGAAYQNYGLYQSWDGGGGHADLLNLPQTGTYAITVTPSGSEALSFNAAVMSALTDTLTLGTAKNVALTKPGQIELLTFSANSGDLLTGFLNNVTTTPSGYLVGATVLNANGTPVTGSGWALWTTTTETLGFPAIPATGTYEVLVEPNFLETVSAQFTISH